MAYQESRLSKSHNPSNFTSPSDESFWTRGGTAQVEEHLGIAIILWSIGLITTDGIFLLAPYAGFATIGFPPYFFLVAALVVTGLSLFFSYRDIFWGRLAVLAFHVGFWLSTGSSLIINFHFSPSGLVYLALAFLAARAFWRLLLLDGLRSARKLMVRVKEILESRQT